MTAAAFRAVAGTFVTGVTVVTSCVDGVDHAMTASAFTSVSLAPLLVCVCVERATRFHEAVVADGSLLRGWAVSVLSAEGGDAARWFSRRGRPLEGQLRGFGSTRGEYTNAVILDHVLGAMECRTYAIHDGGDHSIVLGEVLSVRGPVSTDTDSSERTPVSPLLYYRGGYHTLAEGE